VVELGCLGPDSTVAATGGIATAVYHHRCCSVGLWLMLLCLLYLLLPPVKVHIYLGAVLHGHCHEVKAPLVLKMGQQLAERGETVLGDGLPDFLEQLLVHATAPAAAPP
jgi:hypothetical protein